MFSSPWKLMMVTAFVLLVYQAYVSGKYPEAKIKNSRQILVDDGRSIKYTVTLDGTLSKGADNYTWDMVEKPNGASRGRFSAKREALTNVTIGNYKGKYRFELHVEAKNPNGRRKLRDNALSDLYVEKPSSVGMFLFASKVVKQLIEMQYQYIALSQYHHRATHYHPNVAAYFRKFAADRGKMLDDVTEHVLAKQATEDLMNSCPTDYVGVMLSQGFTNRVDFGSNITEYMKSGFEIAVQSEAKLAKELSHVVHHANRNFDYELSEFVAADLLPRVTKVMYTHKDHLETTLRPASTPTATQRYLVEFLFDKHLTI